MKIEITREEIKAVFLEAIGIEFGRRSDWITNNLYGGALHTRLCPLWEEMSDVEDELIAEEKIFQGHVISEICQAVPYSYGYLEFFGYVLATAITPENVVEWLRGDDLAQGMRIRDLTLGLISSRHDGPEAKAHALNFGLAFNRALAEAVESGRLWLWNGKYYTQKSAYETAKAEYRAKRKGAV